MQHDQAWLTYRHHWNHLLDPLLPELFIVHFQLVDTFL